MGDTDVSPDELSGVRTHLQDAAGALQGPAGTIPAELPDAGASTGLVGDVIAALSGFTSDMGAIFVYADDKLGDSQSFYDDSEEAIRRKYDNEIAVNGG